MSNRQRKILWAAAAVLLSALLWLYVSTVEDPDGYNDIRGIPVRFIGEEALNARNLWVFENITGTVRLTVVGRRTDYVGVDSTNTYVEVDLSTVSSPGPSSRAYRVVFPANLENALTVSNRSPAYVDLFIDRMDTKVIEVRLMTSVRQAEGYIVYQGSVAPHEVRINGPSTILADIEYAEVTFHAEDADQTIDSIVTYRLKDINGDEIVSEHILLENPEVRLHVPVLKTKTVPLRVDFRDGGGLTAGDNINYTIRPESVTISGDAAVIDPVNEISLAQIDLAAMETGGSKMYAIPLPNGCYPVSGEENAVVTLEIVNARTETLTTSRIEIINAAPPEGYTVVPTTNEITVRIRGPENVAVTVMPHNIRVVVDLNGNELNPGHMLWPAAVYIDGFPRVGAVGEYSVSVEVIPEPEED